MFRKVLLILELAGSLMFAVAAVGMPWWSSWARAPLHFDAAKVAGGREMEAAVLAQPGFAAPDPLTAFTHGSIGTELMPSAVAIVLFDLDGVADLFHPLGAKGGDWIEQFGFIRGEGTAEGRPPRLPLGMMESYRMPASGQGTFVPYLGFTCALCHSHEVVLPDGRAGPVVVGAGNSTANITAFFEAFRSSLLKARPGTEMKPDYVVTYEAIETAWHSRGIDTTLLERQMTRLWLGAIRATLRGSTKKYDLGFDARWITDPAFMRQGPGRTHPFGTLATSILELPSKSRLSSVQNFGYSKIPAVVGQGRRETAQFDGTVGNMDARSMLAAFTVGATVSNLARPDIYQNIHLTSEHTRTLATPTMATATGGRIDEALAARGAAVYRRQGRDGLSCFDCHGGPAAAGIQGAGTGWEAGRHQGRLVWAGGPRQMLETDEKRVMENVVLGVDRERVTFRHGDGYMAEFLYHSFDSHRGGHPLITRSGFARPQIFNSVAYLNAPIESVWLRAPYLHNASIPTLRQLLNLDDRPAAFWRGRNRCDPTAVGLACTPGGQVPREDEYWLFDTTQPGNHNGGHDYPWTRDEVQGDSARQADLEALLEYLKTF